MRNFRKDAKIGVIVLIAAFLISQLIRIEKTNPPVRADDTMASSVKPLLKRACFNCHSNETVWPWYSNIAPVSWLVGSDVSEGRQELNFSEWGHYPADVQAQKLKKIAEEVQEGGMPPWYYSIMHPESRLTPEARETIKSWTAAPNTAGH